MKKIIGIIENLKQDFRNKGIDSKKVSSPPKILTKQELEQKINKNSHILNITTHFLDEFIFSLQDEDVPLLAIVTDHEGDALLIQGNEQIKTIVEATGIVEGVRFTEEHNGINMVTFAIKYKQPISLIGEDHYHEFLFPLACYAVPIYKSNRVLGVISLVTTKEFASPILLSLLSSITNSVVRELKLIKVKEKNRLNLLKKIIIDTANVGVIILDNEGYIIDFNAYAQRLTQLTKKEVIGKNILDLASEKFVPTLKDIIFIHKSLYDKEEEIIINGKRKNILCDVLPIKHEGEYIGEFIQIRDITEQVREKEVLIKAKKDAELAYEEISNFLSIVSHELRTPLNAIHGFTHVLKMNVDNTLSEKDISYLEEIHNASKHMMNIVNDILTLSEVEVRKLKLNITDVNLNSIVKECLNLVRQLTKNNNIKIINELDNHLPLIVKADYTRLKQVMINILSNAIKYNRKNGYVFITVKETDKSIELSVKDTGIGIKQEDLKKVFEKFYRTPQTRYIIEGTGIGLSISKHLIESMGGNITVNSVLNEGSVFTISLNKA